MELDAPIPREDRPRPIAIVLTASVALAIGLVGAWLGTSSSPATGSAPESPEVGAHESRASGARVEETELSSEPTRGERQEVSDVPESTEAVAEPADSVPEDAAPEDAAPEDAEHLEAIDLEIADPGARAASPAPTEESGDWAIEPAGVAYLRCEGAPGARPGVCPRDEDFEAEVWSRIETLTGCAARPDAEGAGDLRLELRPDAAPDVRWRDTFHRSVVRLDQGAVLGCLAGPVSEVRARPPGDRTLVSFRFRLVRR